VKEIEVDFPIREGYANEKYVNGKQMIFSSQLYTPIIADGRIFV